MCVVLAHTPDHIVIVHSKVLECACYLCVEAASEYWESLGTSIASLCWLLTDAMTLQLLCNCVLVRSLGRMMAVCLSDIAC